MNKWDKISVCHVCLPSVCPSVKLWDKLSFKETIQHIVLWRHTKINIGWNKRFFSEVGFLFNLELSIPLLEITSFSNKLFDIFHLTSFNFLLFMNCMQKQYIKPPIYFFFIFWQQFGLFLHKQVKSKKWNIWIIFLTK